LASRVNIARTSTWLGVSALIFLLDWFFMVYMTEYGLEAKTQTFILGGFNLQIPLLWLPVLGILLVTVVALYDVILRIFPRRTGPEVDPLGNARLIRAIAFSVMAFALVLYVPYIFGSNWFWARLSEAGRNVTQLLGLGTSLLHAQQQFMTMNPLWQYSISQVLAAAAMILVAWAFARIARRPRKLK
jgi:hypothetical protein